MRNCKRILVISPQPWGTLHISKHHYAIELASRGHEVYFLEPPSGKLEKDVVISATGYDNLKKVSFRFSNNLLLRYKFRPVFDLLLWRKIRRLMQKLGRIDIVWCFEPNIYWDLKKFNSTYSILHMVDPVSDIQKPLYQASDIIFAVSDKICDTIRQHCDRPVYFINHGLGKAYAQASQETNAVATATTPGEKKFRAGFIGNLLRGPIDHQSIMTIITNHPEVQFLFWGPYEGPNNLGDDGTDEIRQFVQFLKDQSNVTLFGKATPSEIIREAASVDMMILAYKEVPGVYDNSNSHKILEYLALGKMVLTSFIDQYRNADPSVIRMVKQTGAEAFAKAFSDILPQLEALNKPDLVAKRREIALSNTYSKQLEKIQALCRQHGIDIADDVHPATNKPDPGQSRLPVQAG